ncbi:WXG100-like domain-containing protein [Streptomyces sp. KR80]|uniref:WXG100-like domain-containing protein n=1 Tax=Streptomyces sp. KR80 TaxID=3457426 RepID=UPI003FD182A6
MTKYSAQIGRAAEDLEQAKRYCSDHSNIALSNEGLISLCLTTHTATTQQVTAALKASQETVRASGREMENAGTYYRETDKETAAKLDATYPASKRGSTPDSPGAPTSGFPDKVEPTSFLTPPKLPEEFSQGLLLDTFNDASDLMSPTYWITEAYNAIFGFNPLDEVIQWFAGDWESFAKCAELWTNLGEACEGVATNLTAGNTTLDATWNGHAADAAQVYFEGLAKLLNESKSTFDSLSTEYGQLAHAAYSSAEAIKGIIGGIIDGLLIVAIEMAAGTLLSWTGVGAAVGYGLAALEIANILRLWGQATAMFAKAQAIVNGGVGVIEALGTTIYHASTTFPAPGGGYNHPNEKI